jgi:mono/diheme cytochrome c family protein
MTRRRFGRYRLRALALTCLATMLAAAAVAGDDPAERIERGRTGYRTYCSNCHGDGGRGDGKMAEVLRVPPANLIRLAEDNGGSFPADRVFRAIDGRDEIRGHGRREMPVWGIGFRDPGRADDQEEGVRQRILDLVAFLESIQVRGAEAAAPAADEGGKP